MADSPEEMAKHKRSYWYVFYALIACTFLTVGWAHYVDLGDPGIDYLDITIGLLISAFKSTLLLFIFMHINHEKGMIYKIMLFTCCFALALMMLSLLAWWDPIKPIL